MLIKVHATSVTAGDCNARGFVFVPPGFGFLARLMFGLRKPRQPILGTELSGEIVEVGKDVRLFKQGDQVFGTSGKYGAYAEYICMAENASLVIAEVNPQMPWTQGSGLIDINDIDGNQLCFGMESKRRPTPGGTDGP